MDKDEEYRLRDLNYARTEGRKEAYDKLRAEYDRRHRRWIKDREDGKPYDDAAKAQHLSLCGFWEAMELLVR